MTFRVLVECKRYSSRVKREVVQLLHQKLQSIGAHKGIVCCTSGLQGELKVAVPFLPLFAFCPSLLPQFCALIFDF